MNKVIFNEMMEANTIIRTVDRNDVEGIVELQRQVYSEYNRDAPFFVWQCFKNVNPSTLVVAQQNTSIVGTFGIQKIKTANGLYGGQISWIVINELNRRSGLFAKMSKLALERMPGLDFLFIFANNRAVRPCEKTLDMRFIMNLSQLILESVPANTNTESLLEPVTTRTKFNNLPCPEKMATFSRTESYRRWRYARSTVHKYFKVSIPSGEYAVIKLFREKLPSPAIGDIVDFECNILDICRLQYLFRVAAVELSRMGAVTVTTWAVPESILLYALEEIGFTPGDHHSSFGIRLFNQKDHYLCNSSIWHLVQSDASNY
jgi:hypothetical protein